MKFEVGDIVEYNSVDGDSNIKFKGEVISLEVDTFTLKLLEHSDKIYFAGRMGELFKGQNYKKFSLLKSNPKIQEKVSELISALDNLKFNEET